MISKRLKSISLRFSYATNLTKIKEGIRRLRDLSKLRY